MRLTSLFLLLLMISLGFELQAKKAASPIRFQAGIYRYVQQPNRIIGHVYEFKVWVNETITIDSVWFGSVPVPCDVYNEKGKKIESSISQRGYYIIKANKDLYKNFSAQYDSTEVAKNFKPPFKFSGKAIVFYHHQGKREYLKINKVKQEASKPLRQ